MVETEPGRANKSAFCRACDDFKTWAKLQKGQTQGSEKEKTAPEVSDVASVADVHQNCPLDKDELGRSTWGLLHTIAAYYPDNPSQETKDDVRIFFDKFAKLYPCRSCADHFREQINMSPPRVSNQQTLSRWLCDMHNLVNQRTGKPIFDCSRVNERWRDGWRDGSCD
uniref:Sulfhydryl oxidase n=1 Tax=Graphocephala atropunctata TaxID=36148 RepID=A0A1B6KJL2_9HEMI